MGHHLGDAATSEAWASACNELIHRVCTLFPKNFVGVAMLPQSARASPKNCLAEIDRCVNRYGFVGINLNPDPSGGHWQDPPLSDRYWYPVYEKMVEYDMPAMIHVSASCNPTHPHDRIALPERRYRGLQPADDIDRCSRISRPSSSSSRMAAAPCRITGAVIAGWRRTRSSACCPN